MTIIRLSYPKKRKRKAGLAIAPHPLPVPMPKYYLGNLAYIVTSGFYIVIYLNGNLLLAVFRSLYMCCNKAWFVLNSKGKDTV